MEVLKEKEASMETPPDRGGRRDTKFRGVLAALGFEHIEFRSSVAHLARPFIMLQSCIQE